MHAKGHASPVNRDSVSLESKVLVTSAEIEAVTARIADEAALVERARAEVGRVIVGQRELVDRLLQALICRQHVLIEGVPGLAKTLTVSTLARILQISFQRIQFTPDLLPADLIGTLVFSPKTGEFSTRKGPVFANIVLADEINRAPAKVQSALLEAMQERQVTIGSETFRLPEPFFVLATQNPIEQEGAYALPEAQIDRFLFKVRVEYPSRVEELAILRRMARSAPDLTVEPVLGPDELGRLARLLDDIYIDPKVEEYIVDLVEATRRPGSFRLPLEGLIRFGASPRASIFLVLAAKAQALLDGRGYVTPQDVKTIAPDVLRHRIALTYEAEAEERTSDDVVRALLSGVPVP